MNLKILFFSLSVPFLIISCCPSKKFISCPNGDVVVIQDIEKLFPTYTPVYTMGLKAYLNELDKREANASIEVKREIHSLREKANQETMQYEATLKALAFAYQTAPCDPDVRMKFFDQIEKMNSYGKKLYNVRLKGVKATGEVGEIKIRVE